MVTKSIVKDPHNINSIVDVVHDCWFKKENIVFDPKTAVLNFKFNGEAREKENNCRSLLVSEEGADPGG